MSVAPDGRIDLVWWDFRDGAGLYATDVYYTFSYDNGQTWSTNFRVTEKSINRKVGTWSNNFDYRAPPSLLSADVSALIGWDDTELGDDVSNTQDLMLAHVQLVELPAENTGSRTSSPPSSGSAPAVWCSCCSPPGPGGSAMTPAPIRRRIGRFPGPAPTDSRTVGEERGVALEIERPTLVAADAVADGFPAGAVAVEVPVLELDTVR